MTHRGDAWAVAVAGDYAYVAAGGAGLRVADISVPTSPQEVGNLPAESKDGLPTPVSAKQDGLSLSCFPLW